MNQRKEAVYITSPLRQFYENKQTNKQYTYATGVRKFYENKQTMNVGYRSMTVTGRFSSNDRPKDKNIVSILG